MISYDSRADEQMRQHLRLSEGKDEFEVILSRILSESIPKVYVEGYASMHKRSLSAYPKNPRSIMTANAYSSNEGFKFWASDAVEKGSKLIIA